MLWQKIPAYERIYTFALGGIAEHPAWWYERGYFNDCDCASCRELSAAIAAAEQGE